MQNLNAILLVVQVLLSASLITLILLQHGKGADAGAAFGSGASATVFGAKGSGNFLTKTTAILATLFFITSMSLGYISSHHQGPKSIVDSVVDSQSQPQTMEQPATILKQPEKQQPSDLPPLAEPAKADTPAADTGTDLPPAN